MFQFCSSMENISKIEALVPYLRDDKFREELKKELEIIKDDYVISKLSSASFLERLVNARLARIVSEINSQMTADIPMHIFERIQHLFKKQETIDIDHENIYECGCERDSIMIEYEVNGSMICPKCGRTSDMKINNIIPKARSARSMTNRDRSAGTLNTLCYLQGLPPIKGTINNKDKSDVPLPGTKDYNTIMTRLYQSYPNKNTVRLEDVRNAIKDMRRHLKWAYYIYCTYTGHAPNLFTPAEIDYFNRTYEFVLELSGAADIIEFEHKPSASLIMYPLIDNCHLMSRERRDEYLEILYKPQRSTINKFKKCFWKPICDASQNSEIPIEYYDY